MFWKRWLDDEEKKLLSRIAEGWTLKSHRTLEGEKSYRLYSPEGKVEPVPFERVQRLLSRRFLTTNQKFPAATFLLTNRGQKKVARLVKKIKGVAGTVHFDT